MCASSEWETQTTKTTNKKADNFRFLLRRRKKTVKHLIIQFEFVMYALSVSIFERRTKNNEKCLKRSSRTKITNMLFFSSVLCSSTQFSRKTSKRWLTLARIVFVCNTSVAYTIHIFSYSHTQQLTQTPLDVENNIVFHTTRMCC